MSGFPHFVALRVAVTVEAIQKLTPKYWGLPRIATILMSWTDEIQSLENGIFSVIDNRILDNAQGVQLAILGKLVGQTNFGWDDASFRAAIRARIRASRSNGQFQDLKDVATLLVPDAPCTILPTGNASLSIRWSAPTGIVDAALRNLLQDTRSAGVKLVASAAQGLHAFTPKHVGDPDDSTLGCGHTPTTGSTDGLLSHAMVI